jgi:hypothetical protein
LMKKYRKLSKMNHGKKDTNKKIANIVSNGLKLP